MQRFLLIDLNNYFSRFYFANPENCVERYLKMIRDSISQFGSEYLCNLIDGPLSFRKNIYPEYKAHRPEKPKDYYELLENLKYNLKQFKYPYMSSKSLEAEDIANLFVKNLNGFEYIILSNDKDLLQLQSENTHVFDYYNRKNEEGKFQLFVEKFYTDFEVTSTDQFTLYLSLCGDSSDNIPGVKGIGPKNAIELVTAFENYEALLKVIESGNFTLNNKESKILRKIKNDLENFKMSYKLVCLFDEKYVFNVEKYKI
jgi:DNA polymerase-1